jgi:hypothetical protein
MRRFIAAAVMSAAVATGVVAIQAPSYAAEPTCDEKVWIVTSWEQYGADVPSHNQTLDGPKCSLGPGNVNNAVAVLQASINECYYNKLADTPNAFAWLSVDRQFGPKTTDALTKVQRYHRITADGGYGPQTRSKMVYWIGGGTTGSGNCGTLVGPPYQWARW